MSRDELKRARRVATFEERFEASFARLQVRIERSCLCTVPWAERVRAALGAAFRFAAEDPASATALTVSPARHGVEGQARHDRLVAYLARLLAPGRFERAGDAGLSDLTEVALAGGLLMFVARHLEGGRAGHLPAALPDAVEFVLGPSRARTPGSLHCFQQLREHDCLPLRNPLSSPTGRER